jgi:hypothetical protein
MSENNKLNPEELAIKTRNSQNAAMAALFVAVFTVLGSAGWLYMNPSSSAPNALNDQILVSGDSVRNLAYTISEQEKQIAEQTVHISSLQAAMDSLIMDSTAISE